MSGAKRTLKMTRRLAHARERVFSALTDPAKMARWFFAFEGGSAKVSNDLRPGGRYSIEMTGGGEQCVPRGTYLEIVPPAKLVFTWATDKTAAESKVTIELFEHAGGTRLVLTHELPEEQIDGHRRGWIRCLDRLEAFLPKPPPRKTGAPMAKLITRDGTSEHRVVSRDAWTKARKALLVQEKEFFRLHDRLRRRRRALPWVKVEKNYVFDGPGGKETLAGLFGDRSQLVVYHFMFDPDEEEGCAHCSFWAEHFDGLGAHLGHRDTVFAAVSRAPLKTLRAFQKRMGWKFKWVSSGGNDFNYDFQASFTPERIAAGGAVYNYAPVPAECTDMNDREGASAFYRDKSGQVYHTYSTFARGIDLLNTTYNYLDLTAKGRDEDPENTQGWVRYRDSYPKRAGGMTRTRRP